MFTQDSVSVLSRGVATEKIKQRPGKAGRQFSYIATPEVIKILNEAFNFNWSTDIVSTDVDDDMAVVCLALSVPLSDGSVIRKAQFGSCDISRGLKKGDACKSAASDALKKCATLFGVGLELYQDEDELNVSPRFSPPPTTASRPTSVPRPPAAVGTPPAPVMFGQAPTGVPAATTPPPAPAVPTAPTAPAVPMAPPAPPVAPSTPPAPAASWVNPFMRKADAASGPNSTQINSLINIASRKGVSPAQLISQAGIADAMGNPIAAFEDLSYDQAIQVIKVAR